MQDPTPIPAQKRGRRPKSSGNGQPPIAVTIKPAVQPAGGEAPAPAPSSPGAQVGPQPPKPPTASEIYGSLRGLIQGGNPWGKRQELNSLLSQLLKTVTAQFSASVEYNWLIIHDTIRMVAGDSDRIYTAINKFKDKREIGLIITSTGGQIEPAYLISKLCRGATPGKFIAVVPRRAKSAATLISCGADEIHMGQMSELGPIDPQFNDLPALGLKNAIEHLAELVAKHPQASEMFASYLTKSLKLVSLGHYERVAESAMQYAERLLRKRISPLNGKPREVARQLVYGYMDHGFVIDHAEAVAIFGADMILVETPEYSLGNAVYEWLSFVERAFEAAGYAFYFYGSVDSECGFISNSTS